MATAAQEATVRAWVGSTEDLTDLDDRLEQAGTPEAVALQILRQRLVDLLATPARLDVDGDVTVDWAANIRALREQIEVLAGIVDTQVPAGPRQVAVAGLRRAGRRR